MTNYSEYCLLCSSLNNMIVDDLSQAWECWNCKAKYWLDDQARLEYMVHHDLTFTEAENDLFNPIDRSPNFAITQMLP